ncbi:hypothetical protein [Serratia liquefaciens]|uniref:Uncharacterized protein n=1 Tax=Serratia liquefaciens TaxID=614 RepID=A0A515D089_SERLI|nr:hypothetical protein [Serratia liquefaciens]QDL33828.1 hypothetical protein EGO53_19410 [Serratia liquefaciens]
MTEEISFMNLPPVAELKSDGVLAVSQPDSGGKPDTFKVSVEQLAAMIPPGKPGEPGKDGDPGKDGVNALANWAVKGGNWSSSYGPGLEGKNAHGHMGICEYWKTTLELDKAAKGDRPPLHYVMQAVPCTAGGEMLPFYLHVQYKSSQAAPQVILVLMVFGEAKQVLDLDSGKYSPLGMVEGISYGPKYSLTYWY